MKIIATIECRLNSKRLPNKLILPLGKLTIIEFLIQRLKKVKMIDEIILATTTNSRDDKLVIIAKKNKINYYRGSENNVLRRVYEAAKKTKADAIVQASGDSPLTDHKMLNNWIKLFKKFRPDVITDYWGELPNGISAPVINFRAIEKSFKFAKKKSDLEHVTKYIFSNPRKFKTIFYEPKKTEIFPQLNLCIDEKADYDLVKTIIINNPKKELNCSELINYVQKNKYLLNINKKVSRKSKKYHDLFKEKF